MNVARLLSLLLAATILVPACGTARLRPVRMVPDVAPTDVAIPEGTVVVRPVKGGRADEDGDGSDIDAPPVTEALAATLRLLGFTVEVGGDIEGRRIVSAEIMWQHRPQEGLDFTVTLGIRYDIARADGSRVWTRDIVSSFSTSWENALFRANRLRLANEGAVRENINRFVEDLREEGLL